MANPWRDSLARTNRNKRIRLNQRRGKMAKETKKKSKSKGIKVERGKIAAKGKDSSKRNKGKKMSEKKSKLKSESGEKPSRKRPSQLRLRKRIHPRQKRK
jgi:hypothetical protein